MKLYDCSILILLGVLSALALASVAATKAFDLEEDGVAEEFIEDIIEGQTGIDLDLTPSSPE